jgi:SAM-dependent methyltransferase
MLQVWARQSADHEGASMTRVKGYVGGDYLVAAGKLLAPVKARSHALLKLRPGYRALDVGCGTGIDTRAMARQVGPEGRVCGVDADPEMVAAADAAARDAGISDQVEHRVASAEDLPYPDDHFAAVRSERLFMHLSNPAAALAEMVRVTSPGGRIVVVDPDWGTLSITSQHLETERKLARVRAERCLENGYSGRRLFHLFQEAGLSSVQVELQALFLTEEPLARFISRLDEVEAEAERAGIVSSEDLALWRHEQQSLSERGLYFGSATLVTVVGRLAPPA